MDYTEAANYRNEMRSYYYRANTYHTMRNPDNDATSGNHHVINATHHLIMKKLNPDGNYLDDKVTAIKFIESTRNKYGWFNRHPNKPDRQTHDDPIGIAVTSKILNLTYGKELYDLGNKYTYGMLPLFNVFGFTVKIPIAFKFYYTNLEESSLRINAWFGRFNLFTNWFSSVLKSSLPSDNKVGVVSQSLYCSKLFFQVLFDKDKTESSNKILTWLSNDNMKNQSKPLDFCIKVWENHIERMFPDGKFGAVLGVYHGREHPFSKYMWGKM